jgi:hypothetical protein
MYKKTGPILLLAVFILSGFFFRFTLAHRLPIINDEQAYIYDALLYNPADPIFWKTPLLITFERGYLDLVGFSSLAIPRILMIITSLLSICLLALAAKNLFNTRTAWATLIIGMLVPPIMGFTSVVLSETLLLLPLSVLILLMSKVQTHTRLSGWFILSLLATLAAAILCRWSAIFWIIPVIWLLYTPHWTEYKRRLTWLLTPGIGVALVALIFFQEKIKGYDIAYELTTFVKGTRSQGLSLKITRWLTVAGRVLPLIVLACLYPAVKPRWELWKIMLYIVVTVSIVIPFIAGQRIPLYPGGSVMLLAGMWLLFTTSAFIPSNHVPSYPWRKLLPLILPFLVAYAIFNKINEKYLTEALPFLILAAAVSLGWIFDAVRIRGTHLAAIATLTITALWLIPWWGYLTQQPFAGTLSYDAVQTASAYAQESSATQIVTGATLIPLLAGKELAFPIPHPAWRLPGSDKFNQVFEPVAQALEEKRIDLVFDEKLTTDTYRRYPRIDAALRQNYHLDTQFKNYYGRPIDALIPNK